MLVSRLYLSFGFSCAAIALLLDATSRSNWQYPALMAGMFFLCYEVRGIRRSYRAPKQ
jgi:hypothetical protein